MKKGNYQITIYNERPHDGNKEGNWLLYMYAINSEYVLSFRVSESWKSNQLFYWEEIMRIFCDRKQLFS